MPAATLLPTGPGLNMTNLTTHTGTSSSTDGAILTDASDATFIDRLGSALSFSVDFDLTDVPADFQTMDALTADIRWSLTGNSDDGPYAMRAQVLDAAGAAITEQVTYFNASINRAIGPQTVTFTTVPAGTPTLWNGARIRLDMTMTRAMGDDGARSRVYELRLNATYTGSGAPAPVKALPFKIGESQVDAAYIGGAKVDAIYQGSTKLWP